MTHSTPIPLTPETEASPVASIDVGTNTILLLIAKMSEGRLQPLLEVETIVRLGKDLGKKGVLSEEPMNRAMDALRRYLDHCQTHHVRHVFAIGTSALREAKNATEFLERVKEKLGLSIEVISGDEEARLSYRSVMEDLQILDGILAVVDVGGGSTELILGQGKQIRYWTSLPVGSVRLTEQFLLSDPVQEREWKEMVGRIEEVFSKIPPVDEKATLVAVGGTATTLASVEQRLVRFDLQRIHQFVLTREALEKQLDLFKAKTIRQRTGIPGLPSARADVILAGGAILHRAMAWLNSPSALISGHGIRHGLLYQRLRPKEPTASAQE